MQLDNTRITIRERGLLETLDLALHVLREFAAPWFWLTLIAVLPLALINYLLIGWMADPLLVDYSDSWEWPWRYFRHLALLTYIESPLASIFVTAYLGEAVFMQKPTYRQVLRSVFKQAPALLLCQLLLRAILPAWLLVLCSSRYNDYGVVEFFLWVLALWSMGFRSFRPFINEVIVLEKNPMRAKNPSAMTVGKRSATLHGQSAGDLFLRWMIASLLGLTLVIAITLALHFGVGVLISYNSCTWYHAILLYPLGFWLVAAFFSVVRYLEYLDLRIRYEGWEVELFMRAEAARLAGKVW